jgi:hypothetical protein
VQGPAEAALLPGHGVLSARVSRRAGAAVARPPVYRQAPGIGRDYGISLGLAHPMRTPGISLAPVTPYHVPGMAHPVGATGLWRCAIPGACRCYPVGAIGHAHGRPVGHA